MQCAMYTQEAENFSSADGQLVCLQALLVQAALSVFIVVAEVSELSYGISLLADAHLYVQM